MQNAEQLKKMEELSDGSDKTDEVSKVNAPEPEEAKVEDYFGKSEDSEDTL